MVAIRRLTARSRPLNLGEKFLVALTTALAVATMALAAATSARAGSSGALPADGPYYNNPVTAISHADFAPVMRERPRQPADFPIQPPSLPVIGRFPEFGTLFVTFVSQYRPID